MAIEVLLVKERDRLAPADPTSAESIDRIKLGETVTATIRRPRNPAHHRKLFALLQVVFENQSTYPTIDDLLSAIKIATGLFETGKTIDGVPWVAPMSISFASMCQSRFEQWYERAIEVILTKILPATNRADLERQVQDIIAGSRGVA